LNSTATNVESNTVAVNSLTANVATLSNDLKTTTDKADENKAGLANLSNEVTKAGGVFVRLGELENKSEALSG